MTVTVQQVQSRLPQLLKQLKAGEELLITENNRQIAESDPPKTRRVAGLGKSQVLFIADDFDAPVNRVWK